MCTDLVYKENWTEKEAWKTTTYVAIEKSDFPQLGLETKMEKPKDPKDATPSLDTTNASVPFKYDAHTKPGLVLQVGTEAISQVGRSDNNQQLANSIILHEPPSHWRHDLPSAQPHEVPIAHQQDDTRETTQEKENPVNKPHGHATADRALERMMTADPRLKPQLVFGRIPRHPLLVEDNPDED